MNIQHIYIIHGYAANPDKHWFPWLENELAKDHIQVHRLSMPDAEHPTPTAWIDYLEKNVTHLDEQTILLGHSLGCITALLFLQKMKKKIGGIILVAGFYEKLPNIPELDPFGMQPIDFESIRHLAKHRIVFGSPQDYIVAFDFTERLSQKLDATLISLPDKGHFMQEDGLKTFPGILSCIQAMKNK